MKQSSAFKWLIICVGAGLVLAEREAEAQQPRGSGSTQGMEKEEYTQLAQTRWQEIKKGFDARKRKKDPFGTNMDPGTFEETVDLPVTPVAAPKVVPKKVVSLQDAVNKFQVNAVSPKKQMVMVGFRSLHRGDSVDIEHDGELFKLRIVKITSNEVVFMNIKNEETASVRLGVINSIKGGTQTPLKGNIFQKKEPLKIK